MTMSLYLFTENSQEKSPIKKFGSLRFSVNLDMQSQEVIKKKKISQPFQYFGVWIAQSLGEYKNLPVYIKLAKYQDRNLLEQAVSYVTDYPDPQSRHKLFMWYLKGKLRKMPESKKKLKQKKLF